MSQMINNQVFEDRPMIKVYRKCDPNIEVQVTNISVDTSGEVVFVTDESGQTIPAIDLVICQDFLHVPGIGFLRPGTEVKLEGDKTLYVLLYGWHCNTSNQNLYSWYLHPKEEYDTKDESLFMSRPLRRLSGDRTVDSRMIDLIWEVTV